MGDEGARWQKIIYEKTKKFCNVYQKQGHADDDCRKKKAQIHKVDAEGKNPDLQGSISQVMATDKGKAIQSSRMTNPVKGNRGKNGKKMYMESGNQANLIYKSHKVWKQAKIILETGEHSGKDVVSPSLAVLEENQSTPYLPAENHPTNIHQGNHSAPQLQSESSQLQSEGPQLQAEGHQLQTVNPQLHAENPPSSIHQEIHVQQNQEDNKQLEEAVPRQFEDVVQYQLNRQVTDSLDNDRGLQSTKEPPDKGFSSEGEHTGSPECVDVESQDSGAEDLNLF
ncbi:unnamed protein product [Ilex paraguariensis]|uniref:Uncharacterized protein n=1 Tax=Ilex paraguariensis TaxID=185542 RepID=A0ABC8QUW6_9AQUA